MNLLVNGQSHQVPPGFRFHPTEEELLCYYLRKKVTHQPIDLDVILDIDLNKLEPWDIQAKCKIGTTPQNEWFFFSHKDRKYPIGSRTNRATAAGFWKATGRDKIMYSSSKRIGLRKTLVFYHGRAPRGKKSDWIMYEYRLDQKNFNTACVYDSTGEPTAEDGWVVCRLSKKKLCKAVVFCPNNTFDTHLRTQTCNSSSSRQVDQLIFANKNETCNSNSSVKDIYPIDEYFHLPVFDPLSASQLNGHLQAENLEQLSSYDDEYLSPICSSRSEQPSQFDSGEDDIWSCDYLL